MEGGSLRRCRVRGSALAVSASGGEMYFSSTMRSSTWLRRASARSGLLDGGEAARVLGQAGDERRLGQGEVLDGLPKKNWLAASTP